MNKKKIVGTSAITIIILSLIAISAYFFWQYQLEVKNNPTRELTQLTKEISKYILLPDDATPTLATVTEKEKLQTQEFFKNAENGDKVLIYVSEGKAILYRPSIKKIIDIAPIQETDVQATTPETTTAQPTDTSATPEEKAVEKLAILLYNGTTTPGITNTAEDLLKNLTFEFEIADKKTAKKTDYDTTVIIDLNSKYPDQVRDLAAKLGAKIDTLPEGETKPSGDILIIVGSDMKPEPEATPEI